MYVSSAFCSYNKVQKGLGPCYAFKFLQQEESVQKNIYLQDKKLDF